MTRLSGVGMILKISLTYRSFADPLAGVIYSAAVRALCASDYAQGKEEALTPKDESDKSPRARVLGT